MKLWPFSRARRVGTKSKTYSTRTLGEMVGDDQSINRFFAASGAIEWIAVRADMKRVTSTWAELAQATSHRKNVAGKKLVYELRPGARWLVSRYARSEWTHILFVQGSSSLGDHHLRELSRRAASDVLLLYGRNDSDKARALACVQYRGGKHAAALLIGEDGDQNTLLDHLSLDEDEISDLDFELEFDSGPELAVAFLAKHGIEPPDLSGELERVDLISE